MTPDWLWIWQGSSVRVGLEAKMGFKHIWALLCRYYVHADSCGARAVPFIYAYIAGAAVRVALHHDANIPLDVFLLL